MANTGSNGIIMSPINVDNTGKVITGTNKGNNNPNISSTKGTGTREGNSTLDVNEFLQLLVKQMQCQDPLEPTDNTQYVAQMAVFTQVEATTQMQAKTEENMASNLVGSQVIMKTNLNSDGYIAGIVSYWQKIDDKIYLGIDDKLYDLADLDTVMDDDYYKKYSAVQNISKTETKPTGIDATIDNTNQ